MSRPLLLASGSPRRQDLLTHGGYQFETVSPAVAERTDVDLTLRELTVWNALRKGLWAAHRHPDKTVLAADTLVGIDGEILGKPADLDQATQILRRLSGRVHEVCTAVFICNLATARSTSFAEISRVQFHKLNGEDIANYFRKVDPLDKAGGYAAQGHGADIIAHVDGSFSNVVGLPMERTTAALRAFGIGPTRA